MFEFYAERFDTVEINNSFYRLPTEETFAAWSAAAPAGFCFAVKASRFLTHMKKLKDPEEPIDRLLTRAAFLGPKLGPILFQLPPNWPIDIERLECFSRLLPPQHHYSIEFRNATWNTKAVYEILERYNIAYCAFHLAGFESPREVTSDFAYVRLHGPGGKYQGSYSDTDLEGWAVQIGKWRRTLKAVYVYFDNDQAGYAAKDAARLRALAQ